MQTVNSRHNRFNDDFLRVAEETLAATSRRGANWCFWIAGLTIVSPTISFRGGEISFGLGLTFTKIAEVLVQGVPGPVRYAPVLVNFILAAIFVTCGMLGSNGRTWAIGAGTVLYALDGLVVVGMVATARIPGGYFGLIVYLLALYNLYQGLIASYKLTALRAGHWRPGSPSSNVMSALGNG